MVRPGWRKVKLSHIAEIERKAVHPEDISKGTSFIGLEQIESSGVLLPALKVSNGDLSSTKFSFTRKHILYGKLRPYLSKIARPGFEGICSTDILPILPGEDVDRDYLYYYLRRPNLVALATQRSIGANLPRLSPSTLSEFVVLLPPLPIQKQIAAILEKADAAREKRRRANKLTEQFLQSAFLEMFGDPVTNPNGWPMKGLGEVCIKITDGEHLSPKLKPSGKHIVMAKDVREDRIDFSQDHYVSDEDFQKFTRRCKPEKGDILLVSRGATIGRCTTVRVNIPFCMMGSVILIKPRDVVPEYIEHLFKNSKFVKNLVNVSSASAQQAIYLQNLKTLKIPFPSKKNQTRFSNLVETVESLKVKQRESEKELENLFQSLMQRAFRGELVI